MKRAKVSKIALCGILGALALVALFLGGVVPFAAIACPVLASLVLLPVYAELGGKWGFLWYFAVSALALILAPDKEAALLFVAFGYYPVLHKLFGRLRWNPVKWAVKLLYLNTATAGIYLLMIYLFSMDKVAQDFAELKTAMLSLMLLLANASFVVYDFLLDRLELFYHLRLRPKLKL